MRNLIVNKPIIEQIPSDKKEFISLNVQRYTTDANGTILADPAIPVALKKPFAFHLFGDFDRNGGYGIADKITSEFNQQILFGVYVWGINTPLFFPNALATINNVLQKGDMVFVYVDNFTNPNYFVFVVVSSTNGPFASLIAQTNITQLDKNRWGAFKIFDLQYGWIDKSQIYQPVFLIKTQFNADYKADSINPKAWYHPEYKPGVNELIIPINAVANQYLGISSFISYQNPLLTLSFVIYA